MPGAAPCWPRRRRLLAAGVARVVLARGRRGRRWRRRSRRRLRRTRRPAAPSTPPAAARRRARSPRRVPRAWARRTRRRWRSARRGSSSNWRRSATIRSCARWSARPRSASPPIKPPACSAVTPRPCRCRRIRARHHAAGELRLRARPASPRRAPSASSTTFTAAPASGYVLTAPAPGARMGAQRRPGPARGVRSAATGLLTRIAAEQAADTRFSDLFAERAAILLAFTTPEPWRRGPLDRRHRRRRAGRTVVGCRPLDDSVRWPTGVGEPSVGTHDRVRRRRDGVLSAAAAVRPPRRCHDRTRRNESMSSRALTWLTLLLALSALPGGRGHQG